jgi:hypothetical protein
MLNHAKVLIACQEAGIYFEISQKKKRTLRLENRFDFFEQSDELD